jgi:cytoskeletal protein RodZ
MHTTMNVTGRPAQFGRGVMVEVGGKLVEQFAQNLRQLITDDSQGGGGAEAGTTEARTTEAGATEAGAATDGGASADQATTATQDGPGSTQPSPVISSAAPSAATTTAPPAQASADSINLVKLVGPALLKRVVPVAVVAAVLALLGRRLFRRGGKD